jgi:DNA-directed RNA polymerase subunit RPC12/RpoP
MALINCPECGKSVSHAAAICPDCGFPIRRFIWKVRISFFIQEWRVKRELKRMEKLQQAEIKRHEEEMSRKRVEQDRLNQERYLAYNAPNSDLIFPVVLFFICLVFIIVLVKG